MSELGKPTEGFHLEKGNIGKANNHRKPKLFKRMSGFPQCFASNPQKRKCREVRRAPASLVREKRKRQGKVRQVRAASGMEKNTEKTRQEKWQNSSGTQATQRGPKGAGSQKANGKIISGAKQTSTC